MSKRKKMINRFGLTLAVSGGLFLLISGLMWIYGGDVFGITFPRNDIVHVGFGVVGAIYLISAAGMYLTTKNQDAMIQDQDERNQKIEAAAGLYAFGVQTLLLFSGLFLLVFMGYMNVVSAFSICGILLLSIAVFCMVQVYLGRKI